MTILARRRGGGRLIGKLVAAVLAGEPWAIGLVAAIVLAVGAYFYYQSKQGGDAEVGDEA